MRPYDSETKLTYKQKFDENIKFLNDPTEMYQKVARNAMRQKIDRNMTNIDRAVIGFEPSKFFYFGDPLN